MSNSDAACLSVHSDVHLPPRYAHDGLKGYPRLRVYSLAHQEKLDLGHGLVIRELFGGLYDAL